MILRRQPGSRFSEVLKAWKPYPVVILGGGPSLTREQVRFVEIEHKLKRIKVIAVNDAYLIAPWADVQYAADAKWHGWHTEGVAKPKLGIFADEVALRWRNFQGQKCSIKNAMSRISDPKVHILDNMSETAGKERAVLSLDSMALVSGRNSGFQALNLAVLAGSDLIILLGFDAREADGQDHWHGEHPKGAPISVHETFRRSFSAAEAALEQLGVRVVNCSPGTAINSFEKLPLEEALHLKVPA